MFDPGRTPLRASVRRFALPFLGLLDAFADRWLVRKEPPPPPPPPLKERIFVQSITALDLGDELKTRAEIRFALDSDKLLDGADAPLYDVLSLLQENIDIELLRVEGHADEQADSRYNLDLSQRRAEAVRAWLIAHGVAPERLQAIGTGEARPAEGKDASRRVEFLVLVWDDQTREPRPEEKK